MFEPADLPFAAALVAFSCQADSRRLRPHEGRTSTRGRFRTGTYADACRAPEAWCSLGRPCPQMGSACPVVARAGGTTRRVGKELIAVATSVSRQFCSLGSRADRRWAAEEVDRAPARARSQNVGLAKISAW